MGREEVSDLLFLLDEQWPHVSSTTNCQCIGDHRAINTFFAAGLVCIQQEER